MKSETTLRPEFVQHASTEAIRAQYERAEAQITLWTDRARELFLLLSQREEQAGHSTVRPSIPWGGTAADCPRCPAYDRPRLCPGHPAE